MWRLAVMFAFVALLEAQSLAPPLAVSNIRTGPGNPLESTAVLGPGGDIFFSAKGGPTPTKSFGDTSRNANVIWRYDPTGRFAYSVALGGTYLLDVTADSAGNAYVSGTAAASGFYTTPGAYRSAAPGDHATFVCKLRARDGEPQYCTYLDITNRCPGIGADGSGSFFVRCGEGTPTPGALNLGTGIYVAKVDPTGSKLLFGASLVGNSGPSTVDTAGNVTISGFTFSASFPTTPNAVVRTFQPSASERFASFVLKLNATGTALVYSTLGKGNETPKQLVLDSSGNAQVLLVDDSYNLRFRRYNADASAVLLEASPNLPPLQSAILADPLMAVDSSGMTTVFGYLSGANFQTVLPTQACQFAYPASGYMARLSESGTVVQATFMETSLPPIRFVGLSVTPGAVSIAVTAGLARQLEFHTFSPNAGAVVKLACAGNGASFKGNAIAPREILSLFGQGLGPATPQLAQLGADQRFPTSLAGTVVTFDGVPAPLLYVSDKQINTVSPFTLSSPTQICVVFQGIMTNCLTASVRLSDPGIFLVGPPTVLVGVQLVGYAAAINQDGTPNSADNPAAVGSIVSLYATGLGSTTPAVPDGSLTPIPIPILNNNVVVTVPNSNMHSPNPGFAEVLYAGPAPLAIAGLSQITVRIPASGVWFTLGSNSAFVWTKPN